MTAEALFPLAGERNGNAKITVAKVRWARRNWRGPGQFKGHAERKLSTRQIAETLGISQREAWAIVSPRGNRWKAVA